MKINKKIWLGSTPVICEVCRQPLQNHFYDFCMRGGRGWARGCEQCFKSHGCGLGIGKGQKYDLRTLEKLEG